MKKAILFVLAAALFYGLFREFTLVKVLCMAGGIASIYLIYRIPSRFILAVKYPIIFLSLCATAGFLLYPQMNERFPMEPVVLFLSFYGIAFYLIGMGDKGRGFTKEALALSILFLSTCFTLFLIGKPLLILALGLSIVLFLFMMGRTRLMAVIAGYTACVIAYLLVKKMSMAGIGLCLGEIDRYMLLAATFLLLAFSFVGFLKKPNIMKILVFFGFLYMTVDVLLVLGFKLSAGLLYQPIIALIIAAPLLGIMLKAERGAS